MRLMKSVSSYIFREQLYTGTSIKPKPDRSLALKYFFSVKLTAIMCGCLSKDKKMRALTKNVILTKNIKIILLIGGIISLLALAYYMGYERKKQEALNLTIVQSCDAPPSPDCFEDLIKKSENPPPYKEISYKNDRLGVEFKYPKSYAENECARITEEDNCITMGIRTGLCVEERNGLSLNELVAKAWGKKEMLDGIDHLYWKSTNIKNEEAIRIFYGVGGTGRPGEVIYMLRNNKIYDFWAGGGISCMEDPNNFSVLYRTIATLKFLDDKK